MMPRPTMASVFERRKYQVRRICAIRGFGRRSRRGGVAVDSRVLELELIPTPLRARWATT